MTRLWLVDQELYSPKLCEEDIYQFTAKSFTKNMCQNNRVIGSFSYI